MLKYDVYTSDSGERRVKFENGRDHCVNLDENGYEYFAIYNPFTDKNYILFIGKIKDAIEAIRQGYGDVLQTKGIFGNFSEQVYRFVDREYGEKLRQQTIGGWKSAEFGYGIKFYANVNSFSGGSLVSKNMETSEDFSSILYFSDQDEAEKCKEKIIEKANDFAREYRANSEKFVNEHININWGDIVFSLTMAILNKSEWRLSVVQAINPDTIK